jgi:Skp family chaperone for outer membrane proteins
LYDLLAAYAEVAMARAERPSEAEYAHVVAELEREREQHEATLKEFGRKFKQLSAKFQKLQKLEAELERERKRREGAENKLPKPRRCRRKVRI